MRPPLLTPLFATARSLDGVGPRLQQLLKKALRLPPHLDAARVIDLLWHTPTAVIDRRAEPSLAEAVPGTIVTLAVHVLKHLAPSATSKAPYRVRCETAPGRDGAQNGGGRIDLIFFRAENRFIERQLPVGSTRLISGRLEQYADSWQMPHPDYIVAPEQADQLPRLEPVYPLTAGLSGKVLVKTIRAALALAPDFPEWGSAQVLASRQWPAVKAALERLHRPETAEDVATSGAPWQRLAYDELLAGQLALALVRRSLKSQRGRSLQGAVLA